MSEIPLRDRLRPRRRPPRRPRSFAGRDTRELQGRNVNLQLRPETYFRLRKVLRRQHVLVELPRDERGPGMMKSFPAPGPMQRRGKKIEQRDALDPAGTGGYAGPPVWETGPRTLGPPPVTNPCPSV